MLGREGLWFQQILVPENILENKTPRLEPVKISISIFIIFINCEIPTLLSYLF